jgi:hypothetical protein
MFVWFKRSAYPTLARCPMCWVFARLFAGVDPTYDSYAALNPA